MNEAELFKIRFQRAERSVCQLANRESMHRASGIGSGVFVCLNGRHLLLTAAHVANDLTPEKVVIYANNREVSLRGHLYRADQSHPEQHDRINRDDIAWFELNKECVDEISPFCEFLTHEDFALHEPINAGDWYTVFGALGFKSRVQTFQNPKVTKFLSYTADALPLDNYEKLGYDQKRNIMIDVHLKGRVRHVGTTQPITGPIPKGISGGGIFTFARPNESKLNVFPKLAGIFHSYHKGPDNVFVGTRIICIIYAILIQQEEEQN